jgi:hypothetical protein
MVNRRGNPPKKALERHRKGSVLGLKRDDAYSRLVEADGLACLASGMTQMRLAAIANTTPQRVTQWIAANKVLSEELDSEGDAIP